MYYCAVAVQPESIHTTFSGRVLHVFATVKTMNVCKYTWRWLLSMRKFERSRLMAMGESKDVCIVFNQSVKWYVESVRHCALTWCTCSLNIHSIGTLLRLDNVFLRGDERRVSWIKIVYAICMVMMRVIGAPRMHVSLPSHRHKCFAMHWLRIRANLHRCFSPSWFVFVCHFFATTNSQKTFTPSMARWFVNKQNKSNDGVDV